MPLGGRAVHLSTRCPSPTTIQYTVSNAPVQASRVTAALRRVRRLLNLVLAAVWSLISALQIDDTLELNYVSRSSRIYNFQQWWVEFTTATQWGKSAWAVMSLFLSSAFVYALLRRDFVEESLLLIRSLGVQTSTSSPYLFSSPTTRFIPATQIQDIFIHEAFRGFEVRFYLAVIVKDEEEAVVVFPKLLPRRHHLEVVWRGAREVLWGSKTQQKGI